MSKREMFQEYPDIVNITANFYAHLDSTSKNMVGDTMENILSIPID